MVENKIITSSMIYKELSNYAFDLFSVFNNKYKATPIKIQKLLFISEMVLRKKYSKSLFPSDIYFECNACGFKIPVFFDYISDFISIGEIADKPIIPTSDENTNIAKIEHIYENSEIICIEGIKIISGVIISFGQYSPDTLGNLLNEFKSNEVTGNNIFQENTNFYFYNDGFNSLIKNIDFLKGKNAIADYILDYEC